MSAAQVAAVEADQDRGRHRVDVRIGSSGGTQRAIRSPMRWVRLRTCAGVDGTADRQQLGEKTCRSCEWRKGGEPKRSNRQVPALRRPQEPTPRSGAPPVGPDIGNPRIAEL